MASGKCRRRPCGCTVAGRTASSARQLVASTCGCTGHQGPRPRPRGLRRSCGRSATGRQSRPTPPRAPRPARRPAPAQKPPARPGHGLAAQQAAHSRRSPRPRPGRPSRPGRPNRSSACPAWNSHARCHPCDRSAAPGTSRQRGRPQPGLPPAPHPLSDQRALILRDRPADLQSSRSSASWLIGRPENSIWQPCPAGSSAAPGGRSCGPADPAR